MAFESLKGKMCVALYALCMSITFIFMITSTPISQFKGKGMSNDGAKKVSCVTVWGLKNNCGLNSYDHRPSSFGCDRPQQLFQASEAFYIISVVVSLLACVLSAVWFFGMPVKVALVALGVCNSAFALIPWVLMTVVWYQDYCGNVSVTIDNATGKASGIPTGSLLRENYKTSAGYGLTIAGWCVNIIGLVLLLTVKA